MDQVSVYNKFGVIILIYEKLVKVIKAAILVAIF